MKQELKILVTGDCNWTNDKIIRNALIGHTGIRSTRDYTFTLIHGGARGADLIADAVAKKLDGFDNILTFNADWMHHGKAAGPIRNGEMIKQRPEFVLAFHDDLTKSKGTRDCVRQALKANIPVVLYNSKGEHRVISEVE